jgi:membrane fusion protein (multidrug efflux system)
VLDKRNLTAGAICVVVGLSGAAGALAQESRPAVPVESVVVAPTRLVESVSAVGSLLSNESVVVRPEIDGRITEIGFEEGQPVTRGQVLIRLDPSIFRAELDQAEARRELSRRTYERAKALFEKGHSTGQSLDESLAQMRAELARTRLEKTTITAPFAGLVGLREVSVGDYVRAGEAIVNLESVDPLKLDFALPERYLRVIKEGQAVEVELDAFPDESYVGTVYALDPLIEPGGRSVSVRATLPNIQGHLRPGLFARVRLIVDERQLALVVPEEAVIPKGNSRYVYRIIDGTAVLTEVKLGLRQTGRVEVVDGLAVGDEIVVAGHAKIRDGSAVRVLEPAGAPEGEPGPGVADASS